MTHIVVQAPREGGVVYSVAPVQEQSRVRRVHRSLLKTLVGVEIPDPAPAEGAVLEPHSIRDEEPSLEGDLFLKP